MSRRQSFIAAVVLCCAAAASVWAQRPTVSDDKDWAKQAAALRAPARPT